MATAATPMDTSNSSKVKKGKSKPKVLVLRKLLAKHKRGPSKPKQLKRVKKAPKYKPEKQLKKGVTVSRDLLWLMTNRNNSFMIKAPGIRKTFTKHPLNPKGIQSFRFSGLLNRHAMSVEPHSSGKGVNLVYRKKTDQNKPVKQLARIALIRDNRRTYNKIRRFSNKHFYRTDLKNICIKRASALLRSQQPKMRSKGQRRKKNEN